MNTKFGLALAVALVLVACANKKDVDTDPMHWGSFKCTVTGNNKGYTGWSTDETNAKRNAMALCREHAKSCQLKSCVDETV